MYVPVSGEIVFGWLNMSNGVVEIVFSGSGLTKDYKWVPTGLTPACHVSSTPGFFITNPWCANTLRVSFRASVLRCFVSNLTPLTGFSRNGKDDITLRS